MTEDEFVNDTGCTQQEYEFERDNREYDMGGESSYYNPDFSESDRWQDGYLPEYQSEYYGTAYYQMRDDGPILSDQESSQRKIQV